MGTYLSTPITEKGEESGETPHLAWGVVDMQGWRKNMEDAHVAQTDVEVPPHLFAPDEEKEQDGKVFGVFDGHGGPEVARFCQLYMVSVLTQQPTWREQMTNVAFHEGAFSENPARTPVGQALIDAFHALDRLINDPMRRDEIIRLRAEKPMPGENRIATSVPAPYIVEEFDESTDGGYDDYKPSKDNHEGQGEGADDLLGKDVPVAELSKSGAKEVVNQEDQQYQNGTTKTGTGEQTTGDTVEESESRDILVAENEEKPAFEEKIQTETAAVEKPNIDMHKALSPALETDDLQSRSAFKEVPPQSPEVDVESVLSTNNAPLPLDVTDESTSRLSQVSESDETEAVRREDQEKEDENDDGENKDDDSNEAVGKEEAAALDQDMMDGDSGPTNEIETISVSASEESAHSNSPRGKVTVMFQKLLSISGQVVVNVVRDKGTESDSESDSSSQQSANVVPIQANPNSAGGNISRPSAATPTIIHNGRQICNLPDHPIHAGCTAVVAVLIGRTLTVANAGDSRAVLCRAGGRAEALSFDHKPNHEKEMRRITNAGGFVNQFGRVNGNLNLSRSIGDLKYKQVPGIHPSGQMITAEPDIVQVTLNPMDEFFILGCDGIWDCLTNEQAVNYVRERISSKTPTEIGVEMLNEIISEDPRASQGIGGDNMTVMIVDLLPHTRTYRAKVS